MKDLKIGTIIHATNKMDEAHFKDSSIIINQITNEGIYGLQMNKQLNLHLHEIIPLCLVENIVLYNGGPVGLDEIGILHTRFDLFPESKRLSETICWGGYFENLNDYINSGKINLKDVKVTKGYCGWDIEQLEEEFNAGYWELSYLQHL